VEAAFLRFTNDLAPGTYQIRVGPPLRDFAGNLLPSIVTSVFFVPVPLCVIHPTDCVDSDGDGLPNSVEVQMGLNRFNPDSNANGVPDGAEDYDGDGIGNAAEVVLGTDPLRADPDRDGLSDFEEHFARQTNPNNSDTDGDGWPDGLELANRTNPLDVASKPSLRVSAASAPVSLFNLALEPAPTNFYFASPIVSYERQ
jgi:hypothetical protein